MANLSDHPLLFCLVAFCIVVPTTSSIPGGSPHLMVNQNGYDKLLIALTPSVPKENPQELIENIQDLFRAASEHLFESTERRLFFRKIQILVPDDWSDIGHDKSSQFQSFEEAHVRIAPGNPSHQNDPYALQSEGCGSKGHYVHLTPDFVNNAKTQNDKGKKASAKAVVRAWAQFRFGVFEECGYVHDPLHPHLYWHDQNLTMTSCTSTRLAGDWKGNCKNIRSLHDSNCQFEIKKEQDISGSSIMFSPYFEHMNLFCNRSTHNSFAPTKQNILCQGLSTWSIIEENSDYLNSPTIPNEKFDVMPEFEIIKATSNNFFLMVDDSASMENNGKIDNIRLVVKRLINHHIPNDTKVGLVLFCDSDKSRELAVLDEKHKNVITNILPRTANSALTIDIQQAIEKTLKGTIMPGRTAMVMITGGQLTTQIETNVVDLCKSLKEKFVRLIVVLYANDIVSTANLNILRNLVTCSYGKLYVIPNVETSDPNHLLSLEALDHVLRSAVEIDDARKAPLQIYEEKHKPINMLSEGSFYLDDTLGKDTTFYVSYNDRKSVKTVELFDPQNKMYSDTDDGYHDDDTEKHFTIELKNAPAGRWKYKINWHNDQPENMALTKVTSHPNPGKEAIHVRTWTNVDIDSEDTDVPIVFYAEVMRGQSPVINAKVTVRVFKMPENLANPPEVTNVELLDDGTGDPDITKNDGIYCRYFTNYTRSGYYAFKVVVEDNGEKAEIAQARGSSLEQFSTCAAKPIDGIKTGKFFRVAAGYTFYISKIRSDSGDPFPPARVTDLHVKEIMGNKVTLQWTAVGDNYDSGRVKKYEIRTSFTRDDLKPDSFSQAGDLLNLNFVIADAKSPQEVKFLIPYHPEKKTYYVALRASDGTQHGAISNIVSIKEQSGKKDPSNPDDGSHSWNDDVPDGGGRGNGTKGGKTVEQAGIGSGTIVGIAIGASLLILIVIFVCFLTNKRRHKRTLKIRRSRKDLQEGQNNSASPEAKPMNVEQDKV